MTFPLLASKGSKRPSLIPAVMQSATTALIKGASTPINVLTFFDAQTNDEVGLISIGNGKQWLAIPLETSSPAVAILTPSSPFNGTIASGFEALKYAIDAENMVTVWGNVFVSAAITAGATNTVGTLPAGFRPAENVFAPAVMGISSTSFQLMRTVIQTNGVVAIASPIAVSTTPGIGLGSITYLATQ